MQKFFACKKRGELHMCKKIKEVNALTPEKILENYWDGKIPVNIKHILSGVGIHFREHDLLELEHVLELEKDDAILGLAFSEGDDLGILFSPQIDKDARNYVLAHEFAHCCLHMKPAEAFHIELKVSKDLYARTQTTPLFRRYKESRKEQQADKFATELLIPTKALFDFFCNNAEPSIESIARHFHVSNDIVRLKIINLMR